MGNGFVIGGLWGVVLLQLTQHINQAIAAGTLTQPVEATAYQGGHGGLELLFLRMLGAGVIDCLRFRQLTAGMSLAVTIRDANGTQSVINF